MEKNKISIFNCVIVKYNVIPANQKIESIEYHWLCTLAIFDVASFPAILSIMGHHCKFCQYVNK